jgi:hypothetical protein
MDGKHRIRFHLVKRECDVDCLISHDRARSVTKKQEESMKRIVLFSLVLTLMMVMAMGHPQNP